MNSQRKIQNKKNPLEVALVPGNPGIPHYYCDFGEELQKAFENEDLDSPTRLDEDLKARCFKVL